MSKIKYPIEYDKTAVLVIDMQNVFCEPEHAFYVQQTEQTIPKIKQLIKEARQVNIPIIYLRHVVRGTGSDTSRLRDMLPDIDNILKAGTKNVEITPELKPEAEDIVVDKPFFGGFSGTELDLILRGKGIDTLIICGTLTNVCCETTARQAVEKEYKVIFLSDANAAKDRPDMGWGKMSAEEVQRATLTTLATSFCQVSTTQEIIDELKSI